MDRRISTRERQQRRRKILLRIGFITIPFVVLFMFLPRWMEDTLVLDHLPTGNVDRGPIEISVMASGKLTPLIEEVIVSPVSSRILEVYKNPGDPVNEGEPLLKLDLTAVETEYRQKLDEREMMRSRLVQVEVRLDNSIFELVMQRQLKEMEMRQLQADLGSEKYLDSIGASTADKVRRAALNYEEAKLLLRQLDQKIENERKNSAAELRIQQLELAVFEKTLDEKARLLKDARILSPKTATLTFILDQIGTQVAPGTQLAVVSDLSRYKVDCEIPDGHREKVNPGAKAVVEIGAITLTGTVMTVTPSVTNGLIYFTVLLDDSSHTGLRSGLNAGVNVLHGVRSDAVRIPNDMYFSYGRGDYDLWVIEGDKAVKRRVKLGDSSFEYVEVIEGLSPGERVILDEMDRYKNKSEIKINRRNHGNH